MADTNGEAMDARETVPETGEAVVSGGANAPEAGAPEGGDASEGQARAAKTIAGGGAAQAPAQVPADWPDDWRQRLAGDDKAALKTLDRLTSPAALFGAYKDLRDWRDSGGVLKVPGKDAPEDDIKAYNQAIGVPDKAETYLDRLELADGAELGEADKPVLAEFAEAMLPAGATQEVINSAANWYFETQARQADELDKADADFTRASDAELKKEWGGDFDHNVYAGQLAFKDAPGGMDPEADGGLMARLLSGRTADGKIIGNDPAALRWLSSLGKTVHPAATVTGSADGDAAGVHERLKEIEGWMATADPKYWKDEDVQQEYRELIEARATLQSAHRAR